MLKGVVLSLGSTGMTAQVGKEKTRSARGAQARDKLKQAAIRVLERGGYHHMRIADVTREAGVAAGLFYHYFPDLKTLTIEVLTDFISRFEAVEEIEKGIGRGEWFERVLAHYRKMVSAYSEHPGLMRCMLQLSDEVPEFREAWRASYLRQLNMLAVLMPRLFPEAGFSEAQALLTCYALGGIGETTLQAYYINRDPALCACDFSDADMAEWLAVLFYRGLFCENPPADRLGVSVPLRRMQR